MRIEKIIKGSGSLILKQLANVPCFELILIPSMTEHDANGYVTR